MVPPCDPVDGFWLPAPLRPVIDESTWEVHHVADGRPVAPGEGVAVRWPVLTSPQWETLLEALPASRGPVVPDLVARWQHALQAVPQILMEQPEMLEAIARYTGYPSSMMMLAFTQGELMQFDVLAQALDDVPI